MNWFDEALEKQMAMAKPDKLRREIKRIVSFKVYQQAEMAEAEGATPRQIEMCLMGASWEWVKANT